MGMAKVHRFQLRLVASIASFSLVQITRRIEL